MNREKKSEIIRQSILTAATSLFEQNGFEKTKVNDIAAKAELSKATFYAYFESKEVLLDTLLLNQLRDIISRIRELIARKTGKENCFIAVCNMFVEVSKKNPVCYNRMLQYFGVPYNDKTPQLYKDILKEAQNLSDTLYQAMSENHLTKLFTAKTPQQAVFYLWISVTGIISIIQKKEALLLALYGVTEEEFLSFSFKQLYLSASDD